MLPKVNPANDNVGSKSSEEKRNEIFKKIAEALRTSTVKPISDTIVTKIVSNFADSLQETNKDLLETLLEEEKKLLKETVDAISKLQGKNSEELDRLLTLAEKLILSGQTNKNQQLEGVGEKLKETVLKGKYDAAGATLEGDQDTLKNRFIRSMTGTTPAQARVQGTTVFGHLRKASSRAFREGMGSIFVSDEERREDIRAKAERENKKIALAQQSSSEFGKLLESSGQNINSPDNSAFDTNGEEVTTNQSNPAASVDTATRSDAQELAAGIRDTDTAFSRSATLTTDPWEERWKDLLDLLNKIKDCVCQCQCTDQTPMDIDLPDRRRPGRPRQQQRGRGRIGRAIAVGAGALAAAGAGAAALGSGAWDWVKDKLGFGSKNIGTATPERIAAPKTTPVTPASEVTRPRPGTVDTKAPRGLPTPANDVGAANDNTVTKKTEIKIPEKVTADGTPLTEPDPKSPAGKALQDQRNKNAEKVVEGKVEKKPPTNTAKPEPPAKGGFFSRAWDKAKSFVGMGGKPAEKTAAKVAGKSGVKSLLKKIPGISLAAGGLFAAQRYMAGDKVGAGMELASGAAGTFPGAGTAASVGIDAALAARDMGAFESAPKQSPVAGTVASPPNTTMLQPSTVTPTANRTAAGLETGRNLDSSFIERGTEATSKPPVINVPPPTVIQAPAPAKEEGQQLFTSGSKDYMNPRAMDSSWLRFQEKRAVA